MKALFLIMLMTITSAFSAESDFIYACNLGKYADELDVIIVTISDNHEVKVTKKTDIVDVGTDEDCKKLVESIN